MLSPHFLLTIIEDADAAEPRGKRRIIVEVRAPRMLGHDGRYLGHDDGGAVYGYTRRQALAMRATILAAAAEDAAAAAQSLPATFDDGFGDGVDD